MGSWKDIQYDPWQSCWLPIPITNVFFMGCQRGRSNRSLCTAKHCLKLTCESCRSPTTYHGNPQSILIIRFEGTTISLVSCGTLVERKWIGKNVESFSILRIIPQKTQKHKCVRNRMKIWFNVTSMLQTVILRAQQYWWMHYPCTAKMDMIAPLKSL